jgi:uncharacterized protein (DUF433 family)
MSEPTIVHTEGVLGGVARLQDYRISVLDIVELAELGDSTEEIAESLEITPEEVAAAKRYRDEHPEEIAAQAQRRAELHRQLTEGSRVSPP